MKRVAILLGVLVGLLAVFLVVGCGSDDDEAADTSTAEEAQDEGEGRTLEAPVGSITVDGDAADWEGISGLDMTLEAIQGSDVASVPATVRVAHDAGSVYVLFEVADDYNWDPTDPHLSGSSAIMWNVEQPAGPHMGADADAGTPSAGMVDLWHWELECATGIDSGGATNPSGPGEPPGNDATCNFDDEWATDAFTREDDNTASGENSLLGVWAHTNPEADADGTWIFEAKRPLTTGDSQDAQLAVGATSSLALAYWDPDNSPEGWSAPGHAQSANQGWIEVTLAE